MSVICTRCGSANVACEAIVNPNGNVFRRYTDESFLYGQCEDCGTYPELTDPDEVKMDIDRLYREFKSYSDTEPDYANCRIVYKDDGNDLNVKISLKADDKATAMDESIFYHCDSISDLKSLAEYGGEDFILVECFRFDKWTEEDLMCRKTYGMIMDGTEIEVTGREVRDFYGPYFPLEKDFIEKYGARHTARCKLYRTQHVLLTPMTISQIISTGNLLEIGGNVSFRIKLHFHWHVEICRESMERYPPFQYIINAYCLDCPETFVRRYTCFEKALLHCLNNFNENINVKNKYDSINEYLSTHKYL